MEELLAEPEQVRDGAAGAVRRRGAHRRGDHRERLEHGLPHVVPVGHAGALGEERAEHCERGVAVDAAPAGLRDRRRAVERQPRGMAQQEPHGRPGRARGLVEGQHLLLGGDEHGRRGQQLGDRRQPQDLVDVAGELDPPVAPEPPGALGLARPLGDRLEAVAQSNSVTRCS
jgi:hypothetical protein